MAFPPIIYTPSSSSSPHLCYMIQHLILCNFIILIILGKQYSLWKLLIIQFSPPSHHFSLWIKHSLQHHYQRLSVHVPPLTSEKRFHINIEPQAKL
jgi:hypothetical protein